MVRVHFYPIKGQRQNPEILRLSLQNYGFRVDDWVVGIITPSIKTNLDIVTIHEQQSRVDSNHFSTIAYFAEQTGYQAFHRTGTPLIPIEG